MKILCLDIETRPASGYFWGLWDQNIGLNQIIDHGGVICFAAKWLGKPKVHFYSDHHHGHDAMIQAAHDLLTEADVVMHYNGKRFDIPHLQREFVEAGLRPPEPFTQIDLLTVVRSNFKFMSNKLANISVQLGLEGKVAHEGFGLWTGCMAGDEKAWRTMRRYNRQDVVLLEELYEILRPWVKNHPNMSLHGGDGCPFCGSANIQKRGTYRAQTSVYQRYHCTDCGAWSRSTKRTEGTNIKPA